MTPGCQLDSKVNQDTWFLCFLLQSVSGSHFHEMVKCAGVKSKGLGRGAKAAGTFASPFVMIKRNTFAGEKRARNCVLKAGHIS